MVYSACLIKISVSSARKVCMCISIRFITGKEFSIVDSINIIRVKVKRYKKKS